MSEKGWVYWDDTVNAYVYRASSLGGCIRSLVAARLGESAGPFNPAIRASMDASAGLEDEIIRRFKIEMASDEVIWQQKTVELPVCVHPDGEPNVENGVVIVRGHIDGMYQLDDSILEVKALGDANWSKYIEGGLDAMGTLGDKYRIQAAVYGHATERKVRFVIGHKVKLGTTTYGRVDELTPGVVPTEVEGDLARVESFEWVIDEVDISPPIDPNDLYPLDDLRARIQHIEECAANDELPECDQKCREGDPYGEEHLFPSVVEGDNELLHKLERIAEIQELVGSDDKKKRWGLLGELADLKDEVKEEWGNDRETRKVTAGPFTASIVPNRGREYIDNAWLRKNHPDIALAATKIGSPFHTLILRRVKGERDDD